MRNFIILALVPVLCCCGPEGSRVSPEEGQEVAQIARPAVSSLMQTLLGHLTAAFEEGGPPAALEVCSAQAMSLTLEAEEGLDHPLTLKRTSFRYRNPENAPDAAEEEALLFFENALLEDGEAPSHLVQRLSEEEYRYYQPLFVGEMCLGCHGDPAAMDPEVLSLLSQKYPEDLAVGYEAGDFRGVVRVTVPARVLEGPGS